MTTIAEAVRERPILFSDEMVRALWDGRKTQTRRVVKLPSWSTGDFADFEYDGVDALAICENTGCQAAARCPYGRPGERLAVKEGAWMWCERQPNGTTATGRPKWRYAPMRGAPIHYVADPGWKGGKPGGAVLSPDTGNEWGWRFKVARFLPRWASRLTLEITDVRVERVQDITYDDIRDEGVSTCAIHPGVVHTACSGLTPAFRRLWDSINSERGYGWDVNPWVWAITFRVVEV